jgi:hypothetical protein
MEFLTGMGEAFTMNCRRDGTRMTSKMNSKTKTDS